MNRLIRPRHTHLRRGTPRAHVHEKLSLGSESNHVAWLVHYGNRSVASGQIHAICKIASRKWGGYP